MRLTLDHLVVLVDNLEQAVTEYQQRGFNVISGGTHADGLSHNALIVLADTSYVELIAFLDPQDTRDNVWGWRPYLARGGGLIDYCFAVDDLTAATAALAAKGLAVSEPSTGGRARMDGTELKWRSARFWQIGHELPFLIEDLTPRELRVPGDSRDHPNGMIGIHELIIAVADIARVAAQFAKLLESPVPALDTNRRYDAQTASFTLGRHILTIAAPASRSSPLQQRIETIGLGPVAVTWSFTEPRSPSNVPATQTWFGPIQNV